MANERLRAQRLAKGWSQEDVVRGLVRVGIEVDEKQLGVTRQVVSRWEREGTIPRPPYPKLLCLLFKTSAEDLGLVEPVSLVPKPRNLLLPPSASSPTLPDASLEDLIPIIARYRSLSSTVPSSTLLDATVAHLHILVALADSARSEATRTRIAHAVNEAATFAGRLSLDLGDHDAFHRYYRLAASYATRADDEMLAAYTLGSMSYWSGVSGESDHASAMMEQAKGLLPKNVPTRIASWFAIFEGSVYAKAGDTPRTLAALERAEESVSRDQEPWSWPAPLDFKRLTKHRGFCAAILHLPDMSIPALHQDLSAHGHLPSRWRALSLSYLSESYTLTKEIDEACRLAREAFSIGSQLQSDRVFKRVTHVRRQLNPWKDTRSVRELDETLVQSLLHR